MSWHMWCDTVLVSYLQLVRIPTYRLDTCGQEGSGLSHCFRDHILGTLVPSVPLVLSLLFAGLHTLLNKFPVLRKLSNPLLAPFSQFLELEDLAEYDPSLRNTPPGWKREVSTYLSALQSLAWLVTLVYRLATQTFSIDATLIGINVLTWVSKSFAYP